MADRIIWKVQKWQCHVLNFSSLSSSSVLLLLWVKWVLKWMISSGVMWPASNSVPLNNSAWFGLLNRSWYTTDDGRTLLVIEDIFFLIKGAPGCLAVCMYVWFSRYWLLENSFVMFLPNIYFADTFLCKKKINKIRSGGCKYIYYKHEHKYKCNFQKKKISCFLYSSFLYLSLYLSISLSINLREIVALS